MCTNKFAVGEKEIFYKFSRTTSDCARQFRPNRPEGCYEEDLDFQGQRDRELFRMSEGGVDGDVHCNNF